MTAATLPATAEYLDTLLSTLHTAVDEQREDIARAGGLLADAFSRDGQLYVFGSGHSHVFAEEAFYRAGGAARICPVLKPPYMLHEGAQRSTVLERESGHAGEVLAGYDMDPRRDLMLVVSNSGKNALPVEVAQAAKERGLTVLAITSRAYADSSSAPGPRLHEVADLVLDNHCPPGDALVALGPGLPGAGPGSSVIGLALLNAVIVEALARQVERGEMPDVYRSAGMDGAIEHNRELTDRFAARNPHI